MLSKTKTLEILESFSKECLRFWLAQGKSNEEAHEGMIRDIKDLKHNPYVPCGEAIDLAVRNEFIKKLGGA